MLLSILAATAGLNLGALSATIGAALVAFGAAFGIGKIGSSSMEAIARQPEAANNIRMAMIIAAGLIEGVSLFAVVVCFMAI
jgi:F-type H+-transporting ATPase subunit c